MESGPAPMRTASRTDSTNADGSRRLEVITGALLDRLTHHVHTPEMNGESCRLKARPARAGQARGLDRRRLGARARAPRGDLPARADRYGLAPPRRYAIDPAFTGHRVRASPPTGCAPAPKPRGLWPGSARG